MALGPFLETRLCYVETLLDLTALRTKDIVLDLSSGHGLLLKALVQATGCRGVGVESDHILHQQAVGHCVEEVSNGLLLFLNANVERLTLDNNGCLLIGGSILNLGGAPVVPTVVYVYTSNEFIRRSPAVIGLLQNLLGTGCHLATQNIELPDRDIPLDARMLKRKPDPDTEEIVDLMSMSTLNGYFFLYKGTVPLTQKLIQFKTRQAKAEDTVPERQRAVQQEAHKLAQIQTKLNRAYETQMQLQRLIKDIEESESTAKDAGLQKQLEQQIALAQQRLTGRWSQRYGKVADFGVLERDIQNLQRDEDDLVRKRSERASAVDEVQVELEPPKILGWSAMRCTAQGKGVLGIFEAAGVVEIIKGLLILDASWECLECGEINVSARAVCEFCEQKRDSGRLSWARSSTPWEVRDDKSELAPLELEETLQNELTARLAQLTEADTRRAEEEAEREKLVVWQSRREKLQGELLKLKSQEEARLRREEADRIEEAQTQYTLDKLRKQLSSTTERVDLRTAMLGKPHFELAVLSKETRFLASELDLCQTRLEQATQALSTCRQEAAFYRRQYEETKDSTHDKFRQEKADARELVCSVMTSSIASSPTPARSAAVGPS